MPKFFTHKRKSRTREPTLKPSKMPIERGESVTSNSISFVEQKIHPDLNSLAEELACSQEHTSTQQTASERAPQECLTAEPAEFVGLQPTTHRVGRIPQRKAHICDQEASVSRFEDIHPPSVPQLVGTPLPLSPSMGRPAAGRSGAALEDRPLNTKMATADLGKRWPTCGKSQNRIASRASETSNASDTVSQTSHTHSWNTSRYTVQPQTPGSQGQNSLYMSTPHSRSTSSENLGPLPSPHTFGAPTPPRSDLGSGFDQDNSYFDYKEPPPPLPPLDHPAFREASVRRATSREYHFPISSAVREPIDARNIYPRHSHSLPSLKRTRRDSLRGGGMAEEATRVRSKSNKSATSDRRKLREYQLPEEPRMNNTRHSRAHSKASVTSSRRSSAEYSAKQASSVGHEGARDECWEVQVSKEMVRLALGEAQGPVGMKMANLSPKRNQDHGPSICGKARPQHLLPGEALVLGSPFLLQDSPPYNSSDKLSNDYTPPHHSNTRVNSFQAVKISRAGVMSRPDAERPTTSSSGHSSRKKGKEPSSRGSQSPPGSVSRRGGGRSISTPSRTSTPSPTLDATPLFGSIQSPSLLVPPSLSVIGPTPEASPISPIKRTHHRSMPSSSALRTPLIPPIIEKSYSNGSGKRKAEEAGVGGDKTPPKEPREQRATFAPDPRIHRTSSTSAHAPSSFNRSKRVRLTESSEGRSSSSRTVSRSGTLAAPDSPNYKNTGSWSSRGSHGGLSSHSHSHGPPIAPSASFGATSSQQSHRASSRRSLSQASIPISALVSPHAPSVGRSSLFHMRDPRKPAPVQETPWTLSFPSQVDTGQTRWARQGWVARGGSPLHAWLFFIGFIIFPLWWAAALCVPIPRTRRLGGTDAEKGVILDDPQVEHDAKSWRRRCRVMAIVSVFTYIPFVVLVGLFA